jgi:ribonuclease E
VKASEIGGMDVVDLDEEEGADGLVTEVAATEAPVEAAEAAPVHDHDHGDGHDHGHDHGQGGENGSDNGESDGGERPYRAMDHASDTDDEIESIAEEDVAEEISQLRASRVRASTRFRK